MDYYTKLKREARRIERRLRQLETENRLESGWAIRQLREDLEQIRDELRASKGRAA